jgi:putative ABC transport system ATP-binding protein
MATSAPAPKPLVVCRDVVKQFPQGGGVIRALRGVDLEVRPGELMLIAGPSGCGKTTLISVIAGILDQTSGDVTVMERELTRMSRQQKTAFRGRRIGFVFQQFNLLPSLTAAENASIPLIVGGRPRRAAVAAAGTMLKEMGLGERLLSLPTQLSGGEQQRVAIARALIHEPQLIVCDEPTSALDAKTGQAIMELLRRVAVQSDRAVIVVTHDPRVMPFGDRVAFMEDGRVVRVSSDHENSGVLLQRESES